nr:hypothetical protein [Allomuricauda sp.]
MTFRVETTGFLDPVVRYFLALRDRKEEQEDSVLAQRYRSWLLRRPLFIGDCAVIIGKGY